MGAVKCKALLPGTVMRLYNKEPGYKYRNEGRQASSRKPMKLGCRGREPECKVQKARKGKQSAGTYKQALFQQL